MTQRYYYAAPITGSEVLLTGGEAQHLAQVMRARPGTEVVLFDGRGAEYDAAVERVARREIALRIMNRREVDRELAADVIVGVALPKGDRQRWLVEKLTELGCRRLVPLITARGVSQPKGGAVSRLERYVVEASKQCRRNRLMEIGEPSTWEAWTSAAPAEAACLVAHPAGELPPAIAGRPRRPFVPASLGSACRIAIGPEGGLTDAEVLSAWRGGWALIDLGPRVLRVETAALLLMGLAGQGETRILTRDDS